MDKIKVIIKWAKSYFKQDWDFEDYPTKTWKNPNAGEEKIAYVAEIINWNGLVGHGETAEKALKALKDNFNLYKENNNIPRPGTKVPFQFASTENIDRYEKIAVDFFEKVLNMDYYDGFYSDGSIFAFFEPHGTDETASQKMKEEIIKRTLLVYNVDITDIYNEPIWKVFARIDLENNVPRGTNRL